MSKRRSRFVPLLALALCLGGAYVYFSPYIAFQRLKWAAGSGDEQALSGLVDFPSVRSSLKGEVSGMVNRELSFGGRVHGLGGLGGAIAGALSSRVVDAVVTPRGISALVKGGHTVRDAAKGAAGEDSGGGSPAVTASQGYEGPNTFVVHLADKASGKERASIVLSRSGVASWRMTGVRFGAHHEE
jgi:hypothetical protein